MTLNRFGRNLVLSCLAICLAPPAAAQSAPDLTEILERFDEVQNSIRTLSAEFVEIQSNAMLIDPMEAEGNFYMTKPDFIRWEYEQPEEMRFVIASDQYTGYYPAQNRAERRSIKRWSDKIFRFIGLGQASTELEKFYTIRLDDSADLARPDTWTLILEPKKKRVRKRVEVVRFWLDRKSHLPVRVEYLSGTGNSRIIDFKEIQINPDLAAGLYQVQLPEGVEVSKGFSGLPGLSEADYDTSN